MQKADIAPGPVWPVKNAMTLNCGLVQRRQGLNRNDERRNAQCFETFMLTILPNSSWRLTSTLGCDRSRHAPALKTIGSIDSTTRPSYEAVLPSPSDVCTGIAARCQESARKPAPASPAKSGRCIRAPRHLSRSLHQHPELSKHEVETAAKLANEIRQLGYEVYDGSRRHRRRRAF